MDHAHEAPSLANDRRRVALHKAHLTTRTVADASPRDHRCIVWDDELPDFGVRISPSGLRSFLVQYRTGEGRRTDRNRKLTLGRYPELSPGAARKQAQALLGRGRDGRDPSRERALARGLPRVGEAVEAWLGTRSVADASLRLYRRSAEVWLKGWLGRRLDEVSREHPHAPRSVRSRTVHARARERGRSAISSGRPGPGSSRKTTRR